MKERPSGAPDTPGHSGDDHIDYVRYNLTLAAASPVVAAYLTERYLSGKSRPGWSERVGRLPQALHRESEARPRIWIHAVSLGEVVAAVPILKALRQRAPDAEILLSVITASGHEVAQSQAAPFVDSIFYFPFDLPWIASRVVATIRPDVFASLESELWPNVLHNLKRQGAATVLVNGWISDRSFRRAKGVGAGLFRWMLSNVDEVLTQSKQDEERFALLAAAEEGGRIRVVGNAKFDQEIPPADAAGLRRDLGLPLDAAILMAGSTHSAEEEAAVVDAYKALREESADLCLVIAPRHIERAGELESAMRIAGLEPVRRTNPERSAAVRHLIVDTFGELARLYSVATLVFIGNTFPPVVKGGGHNILQPLAHGKPVLFGPHVATCRAETALAQREGVGFSVAGPAELVSCAKRLLADPAHLTGLGRRASQLVLANRGAAEQYADAILSQLSRRQLCPPPAAAAPGCQRTAAAG